MKLSNLEKQLAAHARWSIKLAITSDEYRDLIAGIDGALSDLNALRNSIVRLSPQATPVAVKHQASA